MNKTLKRKLDSIFSKYIRLRDSKGGQCTCISCPNTGHWKDFDAGHFISRKHMSVRYDEQNVNAQCRACNRFDEGNIPAYGIALQKLHGEDIINDLLRRKNQSGKISDFEAKEMIKKYTELVSNLEQF